MEARTTCFVFFYKIVIFIVNKEKDDIRSAYCKFSQLRDSQTTLLTPFSCFIALIEIFETWFTYMLFYRIVLLAISAVFKYTLACHWTGMMCLH